MTFGHVGRGKGCVRAEPGRGESGTAADTTGAAESDSSALLERFDLKGRASSSRARAWAANNVAGRPPHPKRRNVLRRRQDGELTLRPRTHETLKRSDDASTTVAFPPKGDSLRAESSLL